MKAVLMLGIVLLLAASTTACATQGGRGDGIQASPRTDQASPHSDRSQRRRRLDHAGRGWGANFSPGSSGERGTALAALVPLPSSRTNVTDDRELMARVREGEQSALELLFARWEGPLFAYFHRRGGHPSWVEDLVEETLVTVHRRRNRYDPARPFAPWLYGIARLVWKDHLRHRGRDLYGGMALHEVEATPAPELDALHIAERREEGELIRVAIQRLPAEQRETFILRHYHGLSYDEIASAVGAPLGTVKWRIHEAVRRLERDVTPRRVRESSE